AKKTGTHVETLLNDLLDIGRISEGVLELKKVPFKITDVAKHIEELYSFNSKNKKVNFVLDIKPNVPKVLIGDPIRLKQILINLIENAYQRTKEGNITLSINQDYSRAKKATISFHIKDSGAEIETEHISKIFNEYYQIEKLLSPISGEGLGLKIVHDLVTLQKGSIQIKNKEENESTFIVSIPFQIPITLQKEKRISKKAERGLYELIKVILIDDSEINQLILTKQFISEGHYKINLATNIEMTLNHLETKEIDVILIDLDMPTLDEIQLIKQLKENILSKNIPVIAISGKALPAEKNEVLDLGVKAYITKPYEKSELFKAINDLIK
ncbi:MAG: response regulator, partial [Flavobacteriaceae bacterium]|nr:response regulator [Flavobacteriaceae bacterium]